MWLLRLHIAISILCFLTVFGFTKLFKETIKNNGYTSDDKKSFIRSLWVFFIPIMNIYIVVATFIMISATSKEFDKWCDDRKREKESRE